MSRPSTLIRPTTFLSPSSLPPPHPSPKVSPPANGQASCVSSARKKKPVVLIDGNTASATLSHYYKNGGDDSKILRSSAGKPSKTRAMASPTIAPLSSFLNDSFESSSFQEASYSQGPSPAPSEDSLSRFIRTSEVNESKRLTKSQKTVLAAAGARLAFIFSRVATAALLRAFLTWTHNCSHVKTSLICGSRILYGLHSRILLRAALVRFHRWSLLTKMESLAERNRSVRHNPKNASLAQRSFIVLFRSSVRVAFGKWRSAVHGANKHGTYIHLSTFFTTFIQKLVFCPNPCLP